VTDFKAMVLFEREGFEPEVGELIATDVVEFITGTRVQVTDDDFCDLIDRRVEEWPREDKLALAKGLGQRTKRAMYKLGSKKLIPVKKKKVKR
jgi:hypothetical protein